MGDLRILNCTVSICMLSIKRRTSPIVIDLRLRCKWQKKSLDEGSKKDNMFFNVADSPHVSTNLVFWSGPVDEDCRLKLEGRRIKVKAAGSIHSVRSLQCFGSCVLRISCAKGDEPFRNRSGIPAKCGGHAKCEHNKRTCNSAVVMVDLSKLKYIFIFNMVATSILILATIVFQFGHLKLTGPQVNFIKHINRRDRFGTEIFKSKSLQDEVVMDLPKDQSRVNVTNYLSAFTRKKPQCPGASCTQEERFAKLRQMCDRYPELSMTFKPNAAETYSRMLVNEKHNVMYCALPKAGSTTINNLFYYSITGKLPEDDIHCMDCWRKAGMEYLHRYSHAARRKMLNTFYKVLVVRHPLDRMVSCWNGKFVHHNGNGNPWKMHFPRMVKLLRKIQINSSLEPDLRMNPTFEEFAKYIVHLNTLGLKDDQHWRPHYRMCHPCSLDYDLIIKLDTIGDDLKPLMRKLNLTDSNFPSLNVRRDIGTHAAFQRTLPEYRQLLADDIEKLRNMFRYDMELFNYHWDDENFEASCGRACDPSDCC
ncbi:hypothetical protein CAPTEDRAFT_216064 [Capitella teleta]|uniref:Carbohydrate sulfotransferase n=1 Tax=Capitella teleta TaxID=283909 RepID=R7TYL9_CAPTE|nr:hypothetical protein CAPTEDRAFT_216064 [Capitella teleta]|eukprot:ELT96526.1 hypothetical protein CAPTEDRAFT_216064 [Capitella teleta]